MVQFASHQWKVAQVAVFPRINYAIGVGKLYLRVETTKAITWGVWRSSRFESLSIVDRFSYTGHLLRFGRLID